MWVKIKAGPLGLKNCSSSKPSSITRSAVGKFVPRKPVISFISGIGSTKKKVWGVRWSDTVMVMKTSPIKSWLSHGELLAFECPLRAWAILSTAEHKLNVSGKLSCEFLFGTHSSWDSGSRHTRGEVWNPTSRRSCHDLFQDVLHVCGSLDDNHTHTTWGKS